MFEKDIIKNFIKKNMTILVISLILLFALAVYAVSQLSAGSSDKIIVLINGQEQGLYSLHEEQEVKLVTKSGYNLLVIEDGQAYVKESDCDNQVCVHTQPIRETGGQIICLPHQLVIRLKAIEKSEIDAVTN